MTGDYALGVIGLAVIAVSVAVAGRALRRALLPGWSGAPALLATALLAIAVLVAISQLLGLAGLLDGVLLVVASVIAGGVALRVEPLLAGATPKGRARAKVRGDRVDEGPRDGRPVSRVELGIAIGLAILVALQWAGPTLLALDRGIYGGDSLWYHLPLSAHIAQTGSVTELLFVDPLYLHWFYPQNSELLHADALLLFGNDFLSPLINLGWLGVAFTAAWCAGRPYGAGAPAVAAVAALMSADLLFSRQPGNANNDVVVVALLLAAVAILLNARRPTATGPLVVAGLAAGLALGTKLTVVPPVAALTVGVIALAAGHRARAAIAWGAALVAAGGLWYMRDLVVAGTPFPFVDLGPLDPPEDLAGREPFAIVHYITDTDVWGAWFRPGLEERLGEAWPLVLVAAVAGVVLWLWRGGALERMLAAVTAFAAVAYLLTPLGASGPEGMPVGFRLNIRYLAPGLAMGLVLAAIAPALAPRAGGGFASRFSSHRVAFGAALFLFAGLTLANLIAFKPIDLDRLPGAGLLAAAVVAIPLAVVALSRRGVGRVRLATGVAVAALLLAVAGRFAEDTYLDHRYSPAAPEYPRDEYPSVELDQGLGAAYEVARGLHGERIALAGTTGALFQYGLWGLDSSNDVRYVGERGERGSFNEFRECPEWITAINNGDFDYLVTTPAYDQADPETPTPPIENAWLEGARGARKFAGTGLVDFWELRGPVDPIACADAPARTTATAGAPTD
ncbi:MAG: hypothetical protein ACRDKH_07065 [Solirubrobacterales bacterium]